MCEAANTGECGNNRLTVVIFCNKCFGCTPLQALVFAQFLYFLLQFQAFHYFVWILIRKVQKRFTKCSANLLKILKQKIACDFAIKNRWFQCYVSVKNWLLQRLKSASSPGHLNSIHQNSLPSCSYWWRQASIQRCGRFLLCCAELWIYNSRTRTERMRDVKWYVFIRAH